MRFLERANLALLGAIDLFDTEQFGFHTLGRHCRRVDDDKRTFRAARQLMQRARRQFLAAAGRAHDENTAVGLGRAFNRLAQLHQ